MSVSLICACKNRTKPLRISLSSWLLCREISEIIIVDWSSDDPIQELTKIDKRIKVIRVDGEKYFNQPQPLNLAAKLTTSEYLLKVDCDHIFNPYFNFFEHHRIQKNEFITGFNLLVNDDLLHPLWGLLYVRSDYFRKVGGYNENMGKYYAVEDDELSLRLISLGLTPKPINIHKFTALHIPHSDKKRVENFESFERIKTLLNEKSEEKLENNFYSHITKISKKKNFDDYPICADMGKIFDDYSNIQDIDYYSKPIYEWEIKKLDDQRYTASKI